MKKDHGHYLYSDEQKEINRALKKQEIELSELSERSAELAHSMFNHEVDLKQTSDNLDDLKKQIAILRQKTLSMADEMGITVPAYTETASLITKDISTESCSNMEPYLVDVKISKDKIPSWEEVMAETNKRVQGQVQLEDLLSQEEFQYCIEDVRRIENEFAQKTKLNKVDIAFLMIATALQTARWIILQQLMGDLGETVNRNERISQDEADEQKKKEINDWNEKQNEKKHIKSTKGYPTWKEIIFGQYPRVDGDRKSSWKCPYDAQTNGPVGFDDGGKGMHRVNTLGHDPILGWIFGTANIMTCTITLTKKFDFKTYRVIYPGACFGDKVEMVDMFKEVYESTCEDKFRLAAGLFAQYAHLKSDVFTPMGLPVPLLEVFSKDLTGKLYKEQYDALCLARDMKIVGSQAILSILINMIIGFVHGLFYDKQKDGIRDHYEVRTRKILLYSNSLASTGNIAYVLGTRDVGKLDIGGLLVTLSRAFSDVRFITRVKEKFIQQELDKVTQQSLSELDSMFEP